MRLEVGGVAVGDALREAQPAPPQPVDDAPGVRARLREQEHVAGLVRRARVEAEADAGHVQPHAVGADQPHPRLARPRHHRALLRDERRVAGLGEAGGEGVQRAHPLLHALLDEQRQAIRRDLRDDVVDGVGAVEHRGVARHAAHLGHLGVDGVEAVIVLVALLQQGVEEDAAHAPVGAGPRRDADDGDASRVEDGVERVVDGYRFVCGGDAAASLSARGAWRPRYSSAAPRPRHRAAATPPAPGGLTGVV